MTKKKKAIILSSFISIFVLVLTSTYYWADFYIPYILVCTLILFLFSEVVILVFLIIRLKRKQKIFPFLLLIIVPIISLFIFCLPINSFYFGRNYRIRNECRKEFNESKESFEAIVDLLIHDQQTHSDAYANYTVYEDIDNKGKYNLYRHTQNDIEIVELSEEQERSFERAEKAFYAIAGWETTFSGIEVTSTEVCFNDQECTRGQMILSLDGNRTVGNMSNFKKEYKESTVKVELGEGWYAYYYIGSPWKIRFLFEALF